MWRLCRALGGHRYLVVAGCVAFPGLYSVVLHGQLSCLGLACVTGALVALHRGWTLTAGLALGLLVFKPHWAAAAAAVFFAAREWRVVAGTVLGASAQLALTGVVVGSHVMAAYARALRSLPRIAALLEPQPGDSLRSLFTLLVPSEPVALALYAASALATVLVASKIWRSRAPLEIRYSAIVLAMILISPHVGAYDLVLLAPVYFLLGNWLARSRHTGHRAALTGLLCASFIAPICGGLPPLIRMQLSVSAMAALIVLLWRIVNEDERSGRLLPASGHVRVLDQPFA
jgi:glycosyl transferase family 87